MEQVAVTLVIEPYCQETEEILIAELSEIGYEGFVSADNGLTAYISSA